MVSNIGASILTAGDIHAYRSFFETGTDYLQKELGQMGISCAVGTMLYGETKHYIQGIAEAAKKNPFVIILESPQAIVHRTLADAIACGLNLSVVKNQKATDNIEAYLSKSNQKNISGIGDGFDLIPSGAIVLPNRNGLIQGYMISSRKQLLMVLPAAPSELYAVFTGDLRRFIKEFTSRMDMADMKNTSIGAGVSGSAEMILRAADLTDISVVEMLRPFAKLQNPKLTCRYSNGEYRIHISAVPAGEQTAAYILQQTVKRLVHDLGSSLYSINDEPIQRVAVNALNHADLTIAIAEVGMHSAFTKALQSDSESHSILNLQNAYCGGKRAAELGVSSKLVGKYGVISQQTTAALAKNALEKSGTSLGVAINVGSTSKEDPTPRAIIAVTNGKTVWCKTLIGKQDNPEYLKHSTILHTFNILRMYAEHGESRLAGGMELRSLLEEKNSFIAKLRRLYLGNRLTGKNSNHKNEGDQTDMARTNLIQRLKTGKLSKNDKIRLAAVGVCLCVFIGCIVYIGTVFAESKHNEALSGDLKNLINTGAGNHKNVENYPAAYLPKFASLYEQNPEVAGWVSIPNTKLDYVVVQTSDNAYYERRDFTGASNQHGVPFVDFRTDLHEPSTNTVIYGHNMNDGQMFGELMNYKSLAFYKQNPIVNFDSVYSEQKYKIFGVVICKKDDPEFLYHNFIEKKDDADMVDFVNKIRERSLINTKVDVRTDDKLLTLSTCDYSFKSNGTDGDRIARLVVFARQIRPGESAEVNTAEATLNTNPIMPQEWYTMLVKKQEAELKKQQAEQAAQINKKWLLPEELELPQERQKELAERRQKEAESYLSYDEQHDLSLEEMINLIDERKDEFDLFLTSDERSSSLSRKLSIVRSRRAEALQWLTEEEIRSAGSWKRIDALITERKNMQGTYSKWLTEEEIKTLSTSKKNSLMESRKKEAKAAGLTDAEINSANSWDEIQSMIYAKQNAAKINEYIAANPLYLDSGDRNNTLDGLKALVAERKAMAQAAGIDPSKYKNWSELNAAIEKANAGKKEIIAFINANKPYLDNADSGATLAELKELLATRKEAVKAAGVDASKYSTWAELNAAVNAANNAAIIHKYMTENALYLDKSDKTNDIAVLKQLVSERKAAAAAAGIDTSKYSTWAELKAAIDAANTKPPVPESKPNPIDPGSKPDPTPEPPAESEPGNSTPESKPEPPAESESVSSTPESKPESTPEPPAESEPSSATPDSSSQAT